MTPTQKADCMDLTFSATEVQASSGIAYLSACLAEQGLQADRVGDVRIALAEAVNNIVEHAYSGVDAADIQVNCRLRKNTLDIEIIDTGQPMPGIKIPEAKAVSVETARLDLPEGGFGWFLIRQLTSDVVYEREAGVNRLVLSFDFAEMS